MTELVKMILNGASIRKVCEGAFSEIHLILTEMLDDLQREVESVGDFPFKDLDNFPDIKKQFDRFITELDFSSIAADQFLEDHSGLSMLDLILAIRERFL